MTTAPARHLKHGYSSTQIAIHWTVASLVVFNLLLGGAMSTVFHARQEGLEINSYGQAYVHIMIGLSVLLLMVGRFALRRARTVQVAPDSSHRLLATLGWVNHVAFYVILFALPTLGAIAWFGRSGAAGTLHSLTVYVLLASIALHVSGSLFHHFVLRDGLIRRMIRPT